jgi:hypothetical protein
MPIESLTATSNAPPAVRCRAATSEKEARTLFVVLVLLFLLVLTLTP